MLGGAASLLLLLGGVAGAEPPALTPVPQLGHSGPIDAVALTPDGRRLASLDRNGTVAIWDLMAGVQIAGCRGFTSFQEALDLSSDGRTVALGTYEAVLLFDAGTGELKRTLETGRWSAKTVRFSGDGRLLAASSHEPGVRLWHVGTGRLLRELAEEQSYGAGLCFSPDGSLLAAGAVLWDVRTGQQVREFGVHGYGATVVAYSPDGRRLVWWGPNMPVMLWDFETDSLADVLGGVHSGPHHVAVSGDCSALVAVEGEEAIEVWDLTARERRRSLPKQTRSVCGALALDGRGQRCVSAHGRDIVLWDASSGRGLRRLQSCALPPRRVAFDHRGTTLAAGSPDGSVALWSAETAQRKRILKGERGEVQALAFSPDDATLACGTGAGPVQLWGVRHGELLHTLRLQAGYNAPSLAFSPDDRLLAAGGANLTVWNVSTGEPVRALDRPEGGVPSMAFSSDGRRLAAAGGPRQRGGGGGYLLGYGFIGPPPPRSGTKVWDTETWQPVWARSGGVGVGGLVEFSPDGRWLTLGGHNDVSFLDAETGEPDGPPVRVPGANSATVAPFGRTIPLDDNTYEPTLAVLSWERREARTVPLGHGWADAACFAPDGTRVAVAGRDGVVRVLDGVTGELLASLWSVTETGTRAWSHSKQWIAWTPEGYYDCSPGGEQYLYLRDTQGNLTPARDLSATFHQPDRLRAALAGAQ